MWHSERAVEEVQLGDMMLLWLHYRQAVGQHGSLDDMDPSENDWPALSRQSSIKLFWTDNLNRP